ncbi:MAG: adaptor protein MecA, partial [Latilactobacillus curvatus]
MEMERINDNTILIKIENRDLQERGMTVMDLFGNPQQIEAFFQEILEEFEVDDQFIGSEALSFQVMPNSEGIEVYISKNWTDEASNIEENDVMKKILESIH